MSRSGHREFLATRPKTVTPLSLSLSLHSLGRRGRPPSSVPTGLPLHFIPLQLTEEEHAHSLCCAVAPRRAENTRTRALRSIRAIRAVAVRCGLQIWMIQQHVTVRLLSWCLHWKRFARGSGSCTEKQVGCLCGWRRHRTAPPGRENISDTPMFPDSRVSTPRKSLEFLYPARGRKRTQQMTS